MRKPGKVLGACSEGPVAHSETLGGQMKLQGPEGGG